MSRGIPDRWIPYSCVGKVIEGTRIICFKVPLKKSMLQNCMRNQQIDELWDINSVLKKIPDLRYVIDLTNTARYYEPQLFEEAGVRHVKIALPGREIPPEEYVNKFCDTVEQFLKGDKKDLVGVHCTHGLNRTGYMVCRYLRDRKGIPAEQAIKLFEDARGYKIERANYLADLKRQPPPSPDFSQETAITPTGSQDVRSYQSRSNHAGVLNNGTYHKTDYRGREDQPRNKFSPSDKNQAGERYFNRENSSDFTRKYSQESTSQEPKYNWRSRPTEDTQGHSRMNSRYNDQQYGRSGYEFVNKTKDARSNERFSNQGRQSNKGTRSSGSREFDYRYDY